MYKWEYIYKTERACETHYARKNLNERWKMMHALVRIESSNNFIVQHESRVGIFFLEEIYLFVAFEKNFSIRMTLEN